MEDIVAAIVNRKEETGMTWREISKRSGVPYYTVLNWIYNRNIPRLDTLQWVLYALGMRLALEKIED